MLTVGISVACGGGPSTPKLPPPPPRPEFVTHQIKLDDACATLFDYCITARCAIENRGPVAGHATVRFELSKEGSESVTTGAAGELIASGEVKWITYDFAEATLSGKHRVNCVASEMSGELFPD